MFESLKMVNSNAKFCFINSIYIILCFNIDFNHMQPKEEFNQCYIQVLNCIYTNSNQVKHA